MALPRKYNALLELRPDIAVISECANPDILTAKGITGLTDQNCLWMGKNKDKGLGIFAYNGFTLSRHEPFYPYLSYVLPAYVNGPMQFPLLGVWAQNASGGTNRKHQLGPMRRAIAKYRDFLQSGPTLIAGDLNNNKIWDKPGWRVNHMTKVALLKDLGLISAYHAVTGEAEGQEKTPTHYWRDRTKDGPTYHIDYIFMPENQIGLIKEFSVGTFEDWCGNKLSDHVPLTLEINEI